MSLSEADQAKKNVFVESQRLPKEFSIDCCGYDFNEWHKEINYDNFFSKFATTGFQATNLGLAIDQINQMLEWRPSPEEQEMFKSEGKDPNSRCKIYLGYTSNMISCGVREIIRYLVQHKLVDYIVTTAGGIEEDFIKCMGKCVIGDFNLDGNFLRNQGINRIGNLLVPNSNYCTFEDWLMPILDKMLEEQKSESIIWSPSSIIARLGKEINHPDSVYYWCYKNQIPVFCPAIIDGSLGDMMYFHSLKNPGLICDLVQDIRKLNGSAVFAVKTGMVILGGGVVKHHICNANLMRNGADFSVFVNTGQEFDGSDSGAKPDEAISWGKIRQNAKPVKVYADASLVFPLLVSQTFVKYNLKQNQ